MKLKFGFAMLLLCFASAAQADDSSLRDAAGKRFLIGAAVTSGQIKDEKKSALIVRQFDCLTAEYEFMPQFLEPEAGKFTFDRADKIAAFAAANKLPLTGHMLCWHQLTPDWMYADKSGKPLPRDRGLANLKQYIDGVTGHFKGKVDSWNVVNEAISDDAKQDLRDTPARRSIGDDYIEKAFEFAHAADPDAALYYNDYNIEDPVKLPKTLRLIKQLKEKNLRIDAVGIQGHWLLNYPKADVIDAAIDALDKAGVKVMITELDVDVLPREGTADLSHRQEHGQDPYAKGLPDALQKRLADRYAELFRVFKKHPGVITRVTFWGVDDGQSWLNDFPVKHRTNHPLLFDRDLKPKPAFDAVIAELKSP